MTGGATATFASTEQVGVYTVAPLGMAGPSPDPAAASGGTASPTPATSPTAVASSSAAAVLVDPGAPVQFAVDLFDVGESTIAPGSAAALEKLGSAAAGQAAGDRPPARDDLWIPLAAIAIALLVLEAAVFQRAALVRVRRWLARRRGRGPAGRPSAASAGPGRPA